MAKICNYTQAQGGKVALLFAIYIIWDFKKEKPEQGLGEGGPSLGCCPRTLAEEGSAPSAASDVVPQDFLIEELSPEPGD